MFTTKDGKEAICGYRRCGKTFQQKTYNQKFCSDKCRNDYFNEKKAIAVEFYEKHKDSFNKEAA